MPDVKSRRDQLLASGQAFTQGGKFTARMSHSQPVMQMLAAGGSSMGRQIIEAARRAEEKRMRDAMVEKDARAAFDRAAIDDLDLSQLEKLCRVTIGNTLEMLREPPEDLDPTDVNWRLETTARLLMKLDRLVDLRHDFNLLSTEARLRDLGSLFNEQLRRHAIRYSDRRRHEPLLKNMFERFVETVEDLRGWEKSLRDLIPDGVYDPCQEWVEDYRRFGEVFDVCADAHLSLERHFEDRVFAAAEEPA